MFLFGAGAEEERVWGDEVEGGGVGDDGNTEGGEEGCIEGVEDGVLGVDFEGVGIGG